MSGDPSAVDMGKGRAVLTLLRSARLLRAFVLAMFAAGTFVTVPSSAQTGNGADLCTPVLVPESLASEVDDLVLPAELCPGQRLKVKNEESRKKVVEADAKLRERESETHVRRPSAPVEGAPAAEADVEDLARMGFDTKVEESRTVYETPTSRYEERKEDTTVKGDGFKYTAEESRTEEEEPGFESKEREEEEKLTVHG